MSERRRPHVEPQIRTFPLVAASAGIFVAIAANLTGVALLVASLWALLVWHETRTERARRNDRELSFALDEAVEAFRAEDYRRAVTLAEELLDHPTSQRFRARALAMAAWSHLALDDLEAAARRIGQLPTGREPPPLFQGILLVKAGKPGPAIPHLEAALTGEEPDVAAGYLGRAYADTRQPALALRLLVGNPFGRNYDERAFAQVENALLVAGYADEAATVAEAGYSRFGSGQHAFVAACAHGRATRPEAGLRWLGRAIEAGFDDVTRIDDDVDLEGVRGLPGYRPVRARLPQAV